MLEETTLNELKLIDHTSTPTHKRDLKFLKDLSFNQRTEAEPSVPMNTLPTLSKTRPQFYCRSEAIFIILRQLHL